MSFEHEPAVDTESLLDMIDGDRDLMRTLFDQFLADIPRQIGQMRAGFETMDLRLVKAAAHSLKGAAATIYVTRVAEFAAQLEMAARSDDRPTAVTAFVKLQQAVATVPAAFQQALERHLAAA